MLTGWLQTLLNIIYPPKCPACRDKVESHGHWCRRCLAEVSAPREINIYEHRLRFVDSCQAACDYTRAMQRVIGDMKFRNSDKFAVHFDWLLEYCLTGRNFAGIDGAVAVPLHAKRMAERGFNQSEKMFRKWCGRKGLCWLDALARIKPTRPQWELTLTERRKNIKDAFVVTRPELVKDKHILLVDDIFTTGVTIDECARVLKQAGAARVSGLALASGAK